jgi:hypothetical protein
VVSALNREHLAPSHQIPLFRTRDAKGNKIAPRLAGFMHFELACRPIRPGEEQCPFLDIAAPLMARLFRQQPEQRDVVEHGGAIQEEKMTWEEVFAMTDQGEMLQWKQHLGRELPTNRYTFMTALCRYRLDQILQPEETLWSIEMREHTRMAYGINRKYDPGKFLQGAA